MVVAGVLEWGCRHPFSRFYVLLGASSPRAPPPEEADPDAVPRRRLVAQDDRMEGIRPTLHSRLAKEARLAAGRQPRRMNDGARASITTDLSRRRDMLPAIAHNW